MTAIQSTTISQQEIPTRIQSVSQWIWAVVFAGSVVVFFIYLIQIQRVRTSASWPTVKGMVEISDLKYTPLVANTQKYQLVLSYAYDVDGVSYHGDRVSFAGKSSFIGRTRGERYVKRILKDYAPGTAVMVHYHPANPATAVLETNIPARTMTYLLSAMGLGLLSFLGWWRRWSLRSDRLFRPYDPETPMTARTFILGALGLATCLGIFWIWWQLIKMYAGR